MFVIVTYDVNEKIVNRVRKILKKYLIWTQNSVFEGEITEGKLNKCLAEVKKNIDQKSDSVYIYHVSNPKNIKKSVMGYEKSLNDMFI